MKINSKELAEVSYGEATLEGRLKYKKGSRPGFKERWFKLRCNLLFYYNLSEAGNIIDCKPSGIFILEHCSAVFEPNSPDGQHIFCLKFQDETEKHIFSAELKEQMLEWVSAINTSSLDYLRNVRDRLQNQLNTIYGENPFLFNNNSNDSDSATDQVILRRSNKAKKQPSFRSYLQLTDSCSEATLQFVDQHFGDQGKGQPEVSNVNTLEEIGILRKDAQPADGTSSCSVVPRPRPMRAAPPPPPPPRPPRGLKPTMSSSSTPQHNTCATENLIDL